MSHSVRRRRTGNFVLLLFASLTAVMSRGTLAQSKGPEPEARGQNPSP